MDTRLLHLAAHGRTPKAYPANAAIVVFPVGLLWWRPRGSPVEISSFVGRRGGERARRPPRGVRARTCRPSHPGSVGCRTSDDATWSRRSATGPRQWR